METLSSPAAFSPPHLVITSGFGNIKPKHQNADGSYPRVQLLYAKKEECDYGSRAYLTARAIAKKHEEQERQKQTHPASRPHQTARNLPTVSATAAYHTHYEDIRKHLNIEDYSRASLKKGP